MRQRLEEGQRGDERKKGDTVIEREGRVVGAYHHKGRGVSREGSGDL